MMFLRSCLVARRAKPSVLNAAVLSRPSLPEIFSLHIYTLKKSYQNSKMKILFLLLQKIDMIKPCTTLHEVYVLCRPACNLVFSLGWVSRAKVAVAGCHSGSALLRVHRCVHALPSTWIEVCFSCSAADSLFGLDRAGGTVKPVGI